MTDSDKKNSVAIVDYGMGNIASVRNMIKKIGGNSIFTSNKDEIFKSERIILPGVGAFDAGMSALKSSGLDEVLVSAADNGSNILGICLGFQLLFNSSEEGKLSGLGLVNGKVKKFNNTSLRVPHMGWNIIKATSNSILFDKDKNRDQRFYFVHSYFAECEDISDISATCFYGDDFTCAVEKQNILGVQFHPEKSHKFGMELLKRYLYAN